MLEIGNPKPDTSKYCGRINLPPTVKATPRTTCNKPIIQKIGPKNVHGFFVNVLISVQIKRNPQIAAKTNMPMNKPKETYPTPV